MIFCTLLERLPRAELTRYDYFMLFIEGFRYCGSTW